MPWNKWVKYEGEKITSSPTAIWNKNSDVITVYARGADNKITKASRVGDGELKWAGKSLLDNFSFGFNPVLNFAPAACLMGDTPKVFGVGSNNTLLEEINNGKIKRTTNLDMGAPPGVKFVSSPTAVSRYSATYKNRDVFVVGSDGKLWHVWNDNNSWSHLFNCPPNYINGCWNPLANEMFDQFTVTMHTQFKSAPAAYATSNRVDICIIAEDGQIYWMYGEGESSLTFYSFRLTGNLPPSPGVTFRSDPAMAEGAVFGIGTDNRVYYKLYLDTGWKNEWIPVKATLPSGIIPVNIGAVPALSITGTGRTYSCFMRDNNNSLWEIKIPT